MSTITIGAWDWRSETPRQNETLRSRGFCHAGRGENAGALVMKRRREGGDACTWQAWLVGPAAEIRVIASGAGYFSDCRRAAMAAVEAALTASTSEQPGK